MALCPILFPKILTTCGAVVIITVIIIGDHFTDEETEILNDWIVYQISHSL